MCILCLIFCYAKIRKQIQIVDKHDQLDYTGDYNYLLHCRFASVLTLLHAAGASLCCKRPGKMRVVRDEEVSIE